MGIFVCSGILGFSVGVGITRLEINYIYEINFHKLFKYLFLDRVWRLVTGLCLRKRIISTKPNKLAQTKIRVENSYCFCSKRKVQSFLQVMTGVLIKASIVPFVWILVCLLRGDYYVCARYPGSISIQYII